MDFFNKKISTLAGLIILLIVASTVGYFIIHQVNEVAKIRIQAIEKYSGIKLD